MADAQDKVAGDCEAIKGLPKPDLSVADVSANEGNSGVTAIQFSVSLAKASPLKATVAFATKDGSATGGATTSLRKRKPRVRAGRDDEVDLGVAHGDTVSKPTRRSASRSPIR